MSTTLTPIPDSDNMEPSGPLQRITAQLRGLRRSSRTETAATPRFTPSLPQADLLSEYVHDTVRATSAKRKIIIVAVGIISLNALIWFGQAPLINAARSGLTASEVSMTEYNEQVNALAPIRDLYGEIIAQKKTVNRTLSSEVLTSTLLRTVADAAPQHGVTLTAVNVGVTGIPGTSEGTDVSGCPNPDPFQATTTIGCVTINGTAPSRADAAAFLNSIDQSAAFINAYLSAAQVNEGESRLSFTASVALAQAAFSGRYEATAPTSPIGDAAPNEQPPPSACDLAPGACAPIDDPEG